MKLLRYIIHLCTVLEVAWRGIISILSQVSCDWSLYFPAVCFSREYRWQKKIRDIGVYAIDSTSPLYVSPGNTVFVMQQCVCDWTLYFFRGMHHFK